MPGPSFGDGQRDTGDRRAQAVIKCVSLGLATAVVVGLVYALFKFFSMLRARHFDLADLWFVPAGIVCVIAVVLLRVVRPLLREVLAKPSTR